MTGYSAARQFQHKTAEVGPRAAAAPRPRPGAPRPHRVRVAALGGGQGLSASLSALRRLTTEITAVVTVADDGGSSGRLRTELGVLPPGDLRKALAALCGDDDWGRTWSEVIQQRFSGNGELHGHAVGNLLIVALWEKLGDPVAALDWVARLLNVQGRVLPMSAVPLDIEAEVRGHDPAHPCELSAVRGQASVAVTPGTVQSIRLLPEQPPAVPEAVAAVLEADWVVLGPGSWFTSVVPHLLVPDLAKALSATRARRLLTLNLAPQPGETEGFTPQRHLDVIADHAPDLAVDAILVDERAVTGGAFGVADLAGLEKAAARMGAELVLDRVAAADGTPRHDPELLAAAYDRIFRTHGRIGPWR
ncbi:gluconeogenesis factor YvcK family protein [Kitasatospora kazusensis]|uniref:gluconeogenesis factor YvcK family protein n=1 Tax=Kitasatospora kazusensis TaxID=407974 RepID=UPI003CD0666D